MIGFDDILQQYRGDPASLLKFDVDGPELLPYATLAAEGLDVDLAETAVLAVPLYAVTSKDRANVQDVCRNTYVVAA